MGVGAKHMWVGTVDGLLLLYQYISLIKSINVCMAGIIIYCLESVPSRIRDHLLHRKKNAGKVTTEPSDILWLIIYHSSPVVTS